MQSRGMKVIIMSTHPVSKMYWVKFKLNLEEPLGSSTLRMAGMGNSWRLFRRLISTIAGAPTIL